MREVRHGVLDRGLAHVKLVVSDSNNDTILKHQFLFVWLSLGNVSIDEVDANDPTAHLRTRSAPSATRRGTACSRQAMPAIRRPPGRVPVNVTGTFPGSAKLGGGTITLPTAWPAIAAAYATDPNPWNDTCDPTHPLGHPRRPDRRDR